MASSKPLHHGPMLPLAIMAMFALMIPVYFISNSRSRVSQADAMRLTKPTNEPYVKEPKMVKPSPKGYQVKPIAPVAY